MELIESTKPIFKEVSENRKFKLAHDTHYDALNFEYSVVRGKQIHRLDFQPTEAGEFTITKYIDSFPFFPRFFTFCHNTIPLFPYVAKIDHKIIGVINQGTNGENLKRTIQEYLKEAL